MNEHLKSLVHGIGVGFGVIGVGGFIIGGFYPAPWLFIGLSALIIAITLTKFPEGEE